MTLNTLMWGEAPEPDNDECEGSFGNLTQASGNRTASRLGGGKSKRASRD